ncbi:SMC-Scp complex subunit ScpB [Thioalkalivibrio sp. HK1]|uniref:SMC-Scp complex subunit ScpB n=1 Tax=Thioalkalivibrio sp. HK1 TaxID=1469245 RepID=UPI0004723808|nr:SMC-Scp complex subunit ScpB [Thioalkalivibrio sp. HK1]
MTRDDIILHIEAVLLAAGRPVRIEELLAIFNGHEDPPDRKTIRAAVEDLAERWRDHSLELSEVASGFRAQIRQEFASSVSVLRHERPTRYSRALMETLALIVYRQPVSRGQIEEIRGVGVSNSIIKTLVEHDWIRVVGHREAPGRPALYGTTKHFLDSFNLKSLSALPPLGDIKDIEDAPADLFAGLDEAMLDDPQSDDTQAEGDSKEPVADGDSSSVMGAESGVDPETGSEDSEPGESVPEENAPVGIDISVDAAEALSDSDEAPEPEGDGEGRGGEVEVEFESEGGVESEAGSDDSEPEENASEGIDISADADESLSDSDEVSEPEEDGEGRGGEVDVEPEPEGGSGSEDGIDSEGEDNLNGESDESDANESESEDDTDRNDDSRQSEAPDFEEPTQTNPAATDEPSR